jgi:hypothetical protein
MKTLWTKDKKENEGIMVKGRERKRRRKERYYNQRNIRTRKKEKRTTSLGTKIKKEGERKGNMVY